MSIQKTLNLEEDKIEDKMGQEGYYIVNEDLFGERTVQLFNTKKEENLIVLSSTEKSDITELAKPYSQGCTTIQMSESTNNKLLLLSDNPSSIETKNFILNIENTLNVTPSFEIILQEIALIAKSKNIIASTLRYAICKEVTNVISRKS
jgi:uncharacterized HAD superfamily protein